MAVFDVHDRSFRVEIQPWGLSALSAGPSPCAVVARDRLSP